MEYVRRYRKQNAREAKWGQTPEVFYQCKLRSDVSCHVSPMFPYSKVISVIMYCHNIPVPTVLNPNLTILMSSAPSDKIHYNNIVHKDENKRTFK